MAVKDSLALFLLFNVLFFTLTTATRSTNCPPPPRKHNKHKPSPPTTPTTTGTCPKDTLKLGVCVNALNLLNDVTLGTPPVTPCCSLIKGLVDLEAAVCLCTALKASVLGINLNLPINLSLLLNACLPRRRPVWPLSDPAPTFSPPPSEEARAPLTVSMVKAPPQPRSRPPPDPPPCKLSVPLETLTPSEPPEPPDTVFTLFFLSFVDESLYTSPHMVTKVVDLESSVSDIEDETTGGVFLGVSKRLVLSRVIRSPDSGVLNRSLPSHDAADPSSPSFLTCENRFWTLLLLQVLRPIGSVGKPTIAGLDLCLAEALIKNDEKRLGLVSIELWTRPGNVGGWSPCLNSATAYPSDIIKLLPQELKSSALEPEFRANLSLTKTP
ncbi:hypothetical protein Bca101_086505 [Brassica carinata]